MKSFLIIGMGSLGNHLCEELSKNSCEIMIAIGQGEIAKNLAYVQNFTSDMLSEYKATAEKVCCTNE